MNVKYQLFIYCISHEIELFLTQSQFDKFIAGIDCIDIATVSFRDEDGDIYCLLLRNMVYFTYQKIEYEYED